MLIKVSELTGAALAWAVAEADGTFAGPYDKTFKVINGKLYLMLNGSVMVHPCEPQESWAQGGPIIEREKMAIMLCESVGDWLADLSGTDKVFTASGSTPLIAAMRCYVASKLGDTVEIPEELK